MDCSFDENDSIDLASVVAEFPHGDDHPNEQIPIKKLSTVFDGMVKADDGNNMKVYLRVRPFKGKEEGTITIESENSIITNAPEQSKRAQYTKTESRHYIFTRVFGGGSTQEDVFEHTTAPLLKRFLRGENCVLFAYGMTNAGKTYTVQGQNNNPGILPKLVTAVLEEMAGCTSEWDLHVSMLEIYQENIYDLLAKKKKEKLSIRDANGKVEVNKLSTHSIKTTKEACKLMDTAAYNRSKSSTFLNTGSSRSHAVYTITLDRSNSEGVFDQSVAFQLVDLAGAERGSRTKATGAQQKEANNINMSLMQLWRCLQGMKKKTTDLGSSQEIIPFRESKLTHLLMPILNRAGMAGTAMVACVNPQSDDYDETLSILGNASIASKIREISDVGRTASQHQSTTSIANNAAIVAAAAAAQAAEKAAERAAEKAEKLAAAQAVAQEKAAAVAAKRRRVDSGSTGALANTGKASARESMVSAPAAKRPASTKTVAIVLSGNKRKADNHDDEEDQQESEVDADIAEEIRLLNVLVEELTAENDQLKAERNTLEVVVRNQVFDELKPVHERHHAEVATLMAEIEELKATKSRSENVLQSVRKKRKQQEKEIMGEDRDNVKEVEAEMERMKADYEEQIADLKAQNEGLSNAFVKLQGVTSAGPAGIMPPTSMSSIASKLGSVFGTSNAPATSSAAAAALQQSMDHSVAQVTAKFNDRFNRGAKNDENANAAVGNTVSIGLVEKHSPLSKSPSRSPLSEVRNAGNSPVGGLKNYQNGTISAAAKRVDSPQRQRDENSTTAANNSAYGTRLRSQQIRA